jgi:hypothetical protein
MERLVVIGILVLITLVIWKASKKKKGTTVLGKQMAEASEKERRRIEAGNYAMSPLPDFDYSKWPEEQSQINPIENELDASIAELCRAFKNKDEEGRRDIRKSINQDDIYILLTFAQRATLFAVRKDESSYLYDGFAALAMIESERCDYRDVLVAFSFLSYGIQKLNLNKSIFEEALRLSEEKTNQLLQQFVQRPSKQKSIEVIGGYTAIDTSNGISFIRTNYKKYNPESNLVKISFDISDVVFNDKYRRGEITIGERIAPVWLSADNDKKIEAILSKATGCASLSTSLRDEFHSKSWMQMLLIYVAEFKDPESLQVLTRKINATTPKSFSRLSFTEGNIFCIAIQRATMSGVKDFETSKSLKRFESLIREKIKQN